MKVLSLFSGAGGADLALEAAGFAVAGLCEIEPHARAVLREHWPDVPLHGDVCDLDGAQYRGVDVVVGGSPCQDLSVAGKRAGLTEGSGTRSSLFFEQVRIWRETGAPYLIWENVAGAFSSQGGADFAAVLSAVVGTAIPVPRGGWTSGGVVAGPAAVAAWRLLDLQHFGVPQRRERIVVLAARAGGVDPAEVLALGQSLSRDSAPRFEARKGAAPDAGSGVAVPLDARQYRRGEKFTKSGRGGGEFSGAPGVGVGNDGDPMYTLGQVVPGVFAPPVAPTLRAMNTDGANIAGGGHLGVVAFAQNQRGELRTSDIAPQLTTGGGKPGEGYPAVLAFHQKQDPISESEVSPAFGVTSGGMGVVIPTLTMGAHPAAPGLNGQDAAQFAEALIAAQPGIPRRLMPVECERLMGWPDDWTRWGVNEKGVRYELKDTPRYRLCGNGIGREWMEWIGLRLRAAVEALA